MNNKSPLRYPGGKTRAIKILKDYIPANTKTIVSPFFGGGSFELYLAARDTKIIGYDAFEPLVSFWQVLKVAPETIAKGALAYYPLTKTTYKAIQAELPNTTSKIKQAIYFYILNRTSFSGTVLWGGMSNNHPRFTPKAIDNLKTFNTELPFTVTKADYKNSILKHPNDFLFLDPPYLIRDNLYKGHNQFDHISLADLLHKRTNWLLCYNDCQEIRELYKGCNIDTVRWTYGMNKTKISSEIVIYPS